MQKNYEIFKNNHYAFPIFNFGFTFKQNIKFTVFFNDNCLYQFTDHDKYDINKLFGVSTSYYHHIQSARFGWRCVDNENIEILAYTYDNKERLPEKLLMTIKPFQNIECKIQIEDRKITYFVTHIGKTVSYSVDLIKNTWKFKYKLFPYFGGNKKAPKSMNIIFKNFIYS